MKDLLKLLTGIALGISLVLSCSDDSPAPADAAVCDCAPAEPPIASRIVPLEKNVVLPPANGVENGRNGNDLLCPDRAILLNGGCLASVGQVPDVVIEQSGPLTAQSGIVLGSWYCQWRNNTNNPVTVRVIANCLMPAQ
jgi:hypothetical protein